MTEHVPEVGQLTIENDSHGYGSAFHAVPDRRVVGPAIIRVQCVGGGSPWWVGLDRQQCLELMRWLAQEVAAYDEEQKNV